jgi:phosphoglycolate phosphatase
MHYPRAVVFDLDGTLVDTAADLHRVLRSLMDEEGLPTPSLPSLRAMVGDGAKALLARAFTAADVTPAPARLDALYDEFLTRYTAEPCQFSTLYDGAAAVLDELKGAGCRLGLCTNKPQQPSERLLEALGVADRFACIIGGDVLNVRKPDPLHLQAVLRELQVPAAEAVMVGDSRNDVVTAHAAGLPCVLVSFGYTTVPVAELGAELVIDRLTELPAALASLRERALTPEGLLRTSAATSGA